MTGHAKENLKKIKEILSDEKETDDEKNTRFIEMLEKNEFKGKEESLRQTFEIGFKDLDNEKFSIVKSYLALKGYDVI